MADIQADQAADAAQEIAQELDELRELAARFRRLAPTAKGPALRAILVKREALLGAISAGVSRMAQSAKESGGPEPAGAQRGAFAAVLREVTDLDRESRAALRKRANDVADEVLKLRAGRKWRQSSSQ
jgi:hypothetical protein